MQVWTILSTILLICAGGDAFKILVFFPTPSISHQQAIIAMTERLVQKGHELFVVSPNPVPGLKNSNYTFLDMSFCYAFFSDQDKEDVVFLQRVISKWDSVPPFRGAASVIGKQFLSPPFLEFRKRIEAEKLKFDVVISEFYVTPYTCAMTRLLTENTPIISMSTISDDFNEENLGSIHHMSFLPSTFNPYSDKMTLWQRIENWVSHTYLTYKITEGIEEDARTFFRDNYGAEGLVDGCWANVSLSMIASNSMYLYPRLLGPNVIELGPLHIKTPEKLPKNLQDWLDGAEKGVIYFSLGSNMKGKSLPEDVRSNFLKFFRELPPGYRVLWKWELDGKIPGQSDNILGQKWVPQQSVLAHPKVKVFITQGGLQSFHETVHYGVATVGIPWFGDQVRNVGKMVDAEIGVRLEPHELFSYQKIKTALEKVLFDKRYSENMKRHSAISRDFTSQSLDKAVFWVEHVARHGGASHLRPSTADTTYFQFFCLDIISVILALSFVVLYVIIFIFRRLVSLFSSSHSKIKKP